MARRPLKPSPMNPKDQAALGRVPLHLLPSVGAMHGAMACRDGAIKYGPYNWRDKPISLMGYIGAMKRHLALLEAGQDFATDNGVHHLGAVNATTAILLDARAAGTLIDDRPPNGAGAVLELERLNAECATLAAKAKKGGRS
jgi:hypothetical protein